MNLERAAEDTIDAAREHTFSCRDEKGRKASHAIWMLEGIRDGYIQHEKGHRWLGYAQGLLVAHEVLTLDEVKGINKSA